MFSGGLSARLVAEGESCLLCEGRGMVFCGRRIGGLSAVEEKGGGSLLWEDRGSVCYGSSRGGGCLL
jgi:hypothetical protein